MKMSKKAWAGTVLPLMVLAAVAITMDWASLVQRGALPF